MRPMPHSQNPTPPSRSRHLPAAPFAMFGKPSVESGGPMRRYRLLAGFITLLLAVLVFPAIPYPALAVSGPAAPVAETNDFATQVLHDPWDMAQFTDVSQYLNESGQRDLLHNIGVANGVFSAQSTSVKDAAFYTLFPGYILPDGGKAIQPGKAGVNYPIASATYK